MLLFSIGDGSNLQEMAPTLGLFAFAGFRLLPSVSQLYQAYNNLTFNSVVLDKLYTERKLSNDLPESTKVTTELEGSDSYSFHFEDVSFNYKSSDSIKVKIDNSNYDFYADEDTAWAKEDKKVIYAMKRGMELIITGISSKGTTVVDSYTLKGFTAAFNLLSEDCSL